MMTCELIYDATMTKEERENRADEWFFNGGYETMNELQQVEFLVDECGYTEEGAIALVYYPMGDDDTDYLIAE